MRLISFNVLRLHGFLDIPINFNDDLTVILGINGSGKTSALSLMAALMRLDFATMTAMKFESARLVAEGADGGAISIDASCDGSALHLTLEIDGKSHKLTDLSLGNERFLFHDLAKNSAVLDARSAVHTWTLPYLNMAMSGPLVLSDELKAAKKFVAQSKLTFVQLDRTIVAIDPDGEEAVERMWKPAGAKKPKPLAEPINEVLRVTKQKYLEYKNATEAIKDAAYRDSLRLHFDPIGSNNKGKIDHASLTKKLDSMKTRVAKSALTSNESELKAAAQVFFKEFETLLANVSKQSALKRAGRRTLDEEQLDAILTVKHRQIERLLEVFEAEARTTQDAYAPIRRYLSTVDKFFRESGKRLTFDANYELGFTVDSLKSDSDSQEIRPRSLKELSSGERQILIILTYLTFVSGNNSVFVIDEPELSLHLVWQRLLIDAIKELRPSGCQVILATHAPEIVGRALDKSVRLGRRSVGRENQKNG